MTLSQDKDWSEEIKRVLDTLSQREAEVITLYFGLNHEKALTLEEIGARFNLTRERIRQIKEKGLYNLRRAGHGDILERILE